MSVPALPSLPRLPSLPGGTRPLDPVVLPKLDVQPATDEFGFGPWAKETPRASRRYMAVAYEDAHLDKRFQPAVYFGVGAGTIPELVVIGWLIVNGYRRGQRNRGYDFQDDRLGGRQLPGGAVVDVIVYRAARTIGVRVYSIYHSLRDPFGNGGVAVSVNRYQAVRLLSRGAIDTIIDVNLNRVLEIGYDAAVELDLKRIENNASNSLQIR